MKNPSELNSIPSETHAEMSVQDLRRIQVREPAAACEIIPSPYRVAHVLTQAEYPDEVEYRTRSLKIVILGLTITSSWGNGHTTTYRALVRELQARGHRITFLERDAKCHASNRDLPKPPCTTVGHYNSFAELKDKYTAAVRQADVVIVGSCVPEGSLIGTWVTRTAKGVTAFYDIDTPSTVAGLRSGNLDYISLPLIGRYDMYLSFTGGPILDYIQNRLGSPLARPLYGSVDTTLYYPDPQTIRWDLGYMGIYSDDRQPAVDELLLEPARNWEQGRFAVAGPQYPRTLRWPKNVKRFTHLPPSRHRGFYNSQKFTLNVTRAEMVEAGFSPSLRLFEAAACGTPIITDYWEGLETFFKPDEEILVSHSSEESLYYLLETTEEQRRLLGNRARARVLSAHTARHRAIELENYVFDLIKPSRQ